VAGQPGLEVILLCRQRAGAAPHVHRIRTRHAPEPDGSAAGWRVNELAPYPARGADGPGCGIWVGSALMGSWSRSRPPGASASVSVITGPSGVRGCRRIPRRRRPSPATAGEASAARRSSCTAATRTRQSHGTPGRRRHARRHRCTLHLSDPAGTWAFSLLRVRRRMMRQPARQTPRAFGELRPELQHVGHRSARCDRL
jgi:hypothetical protein